VRDLDIYQKPTPRRREVGAGEFGVKGGAFADETRGYPRFLTKYRERIEKMNRRLQKVLREEKGFTALETAIILMAFIVVASVFAFTILSSGMTSTEKSKKAIAEGMSEVQGSLELRGSVIATSSDDTNVEDVIFCLANVAGGEAIDLTSGASSRTLVIDYTDAVTHTTDLTWTVDFQGYTDGDNLLEDRELAEITVPLSSTNGITLDANKNFVIELKPQKGGVLPIERTTPPEIEAAMDLG
jgi:flagellin FlaB